MSADATTLANAPADAHADDHHGPSDWIFVKTAIFLAVITALEVIWSYLPWGHGAAIVFAEVGGLLIMMAVKFYIVAAVFMHLKYDSKILTRVFYAGLALAVAVYLAVLSTFEIWSGGLS